MRTVAATRQTPQPDLTSAPKALSWLVYLRDNAGQLKLTKMEWALAAIFPTCGQGQNITLSIKGMADILDSDRETIGNALKRLIARGLVLYVGPGRHNKNVYRLTLPRCRPDRQSGVGETDSGVSVRPTVGDGQTDTTSRENEDLDQQLHQHADDDVADASPSGENRAKASTRTRATARAKKDSPVEHDYPALEVYIGDLEGCVDDLEHRLGMDPGTVNIKALAKSWREMTIRHEQKAGVSAHLNEFPADHEMWSRCASKDRPVGYFLNEVDRWLAENYPVDAEAAA